MSNEFRVIEDAGLVPLRARHSGQLARLVAALKFLKPGGAVALSLEDGEKANLAWMHQRAAEKLGIPRRSFIGRTVTLDDGTREYRIYRVEADDA